MSTTPAKSGGGSKKNNGGTIVNAGNVPAGSPTTKVVGLNEVNGARNDYGTKVVTDTNGGAADADPRGVTKAKSSGTFAYTPAKGTNFLIRAAGDNASKVNNSASTLLNVPGGVSNVSVNKLITTRRVGAYADAKFNVLAVPNGNIFPGRTKGTGSGSVVNYTSTTNGSASGTDDAASSTRTVPGELTYMFGGKLPLNANYKSRDSYEA
jgi:hypothetical protein